MDLFYTTGKSTPVSLKDETNLTEVELPRQSLGTGRQKSIPPQDTCFQKWRTQISALLNELTLSNTLAWQVPEREIHEALRGSELVEAIQDLGRGSRGALEAELRRMLDDVRHQARSNEVASLSPPWVFLGSTDSSDRELLYRRDSAVLDKPVCTGKLFF